MILGFKTKTDDGKPTLFPEKVLQCLMSEVWISIVAWNEIMKDSPYGQMAVGTFKPKLHSMREDIHDRWKPGVMIDFFTGVRTKQAYRFAPRVKVVSVQKVEIKRVDDMRFENEDKTVYRVDVYSPVLKETFVMAFQVLVDGKALVRSKIKALAINDGFETAEDFFSWFKNNGWKGKIIHWTNLRY